jgi:hypothetical protein
MYNKIFSGYQPHQMVKWRKNQRFEDYLCPRPQGTEGYPEYPEDEDGRTRVLKGTLSTLRTRTEMVLETLVYSPFNHLTRLVAEEDFIIGLLWTYHENIRNR